MPNWQGDQVTPGFETPPAFRRSEEPKTFLVNFYFALAAIFAACSAILISWIVYRYIPGSAPEDTGFWTTLAFQIGTGGSALILCKMASDEARQRGIRFWSKTSEVCYVPVALTIVCVGGIFVAGPFGKTSMIIPLFALACVSSVMAILCLFWTEGDSVGG